METGPRFIASLDRLEKPGIESAIPGLQSESVKHCATEASIYALIRCTSQKETLTFTLYSELSDTSVSALLTLVLDIVS